MFHQCGRDRHIADLWHAGIAFGAAAFQHKDRVGGDGQILPVNVGFHVFDIFKHMGNAFVFQQGWRGGGWFDDRAVGGKIAFQHANASGRFDRIVKRTDHIGVVTVSTFVIGGNVFAHNGLRGAQMVTQFFQNHRNAAGIGEILHQVFTGGHAVDQQGDIGAKFEILQVQRNANPARQSQQMHHGVGRPTNGRIGEDRIFKRGAGQDLAGAQVFFDHFNDPPPCVMRQRHAAGINGGKGCVGGQRHAHRLDK